MNYRAAIFALSFAAILAVVSGSEVSGTEVDMNNARNPFKFVKKKAVKKVQRIPKGRKAKTRVDLIMIKGAEKLAVIGDKSYRVGDIFDGKPITSITLDYVELFSKNGNKRLYLK